MKSAPSARPRLLGQPRPVEAKRKYWLKRGRDSCGQLFAPPRTYAPPAFIAGENGRDLIPLTTAESRRLFNLHMPVAHPDEFRLRWSGWRRYRQAAARKSHYARRLRDHKVPGR
jgi:hypothetical protein